jgi:hypothetical protein
MLLFRLLLCAFDNVFHARATALSCLQAETGWRLNNAPVSMMHTTGPPADPVVLSHAAGALMRLISVSIRPHDASLGTFIASSGQSISASKPGRECQGKGGHKRHRVER